MDVQEKGLLTESYAFEGFVLDADLCELRGPAGRIDVQRKVLHLLFYLARHADRAVSKEELLEAVWPGTVVSDSVLSQAVRKARGALGDDGAAQQLIRTVHGHGYRLEASVRRLDSQGADAPAVAPAVATPALAPAFDPLERTDVPGFGEAVDDAVPAFAPLPPTATRGAPRPVLRWALGAGVAAIVLAAVLLATGGG